MYSGWMLTEESKNILMGLFLPRFPDVLAHHITHSVNQKMIPHPVVAKVIGHATDNASIECLVVEIDGSADREHGGHYHITWSLDREAGRKPVHSNQLLRDGYEKLGYSFYITVVPFWCDDDGVDHLVLEPVVDAGS